MRFAGGRDGALRALERAYNGTRRSGGDVSFVIGQAIGVALASDEPKALSPWIDRAVELDPDDLVYFGAWAEALLTRHGLQNEALSSAVKRAKPKSPWVAELASARNTRTLSRLTELAQHDAERAEAAFYTGLEQWAQRRDDEARTSFRACRSFRALDLMEHGFSEALLTGIPKLVLPPDRALP
jgi:hypothetical protein